MGRISGRSEWAGYQVGPSWPDRPFVNIFGLLKIIPFLSFFFSGSPLMCLSASLSIFSAVLWTVCPCFHVCYDNNKGPTTKVMIRALNLSALRPSSINSLHHVTTVSWSLRISCAQFFFKEKDNFVTAVDRNICLKQIKLPISLHIVYSCAPLSKLPSD